MKAKKYYLKGLVQGVFFRKYTQAKAQALGLSGWVRNRSDGTVEVLAQGSAEKLEELRQWLWQGSPASEVGSVTEEDQAPFEATEFTIERTV